VAALDFLARKDIRLISSLGLPSWELSTYLAGRQGIELELIVPGPRFPEPGEQCERVLSDFRLDPGKTRLIFTGEGPPKSLLSLRDRLALEQAEVVYPVSLRPGGRLEKLLAECENGTIEIREEFRIDWSRSGWRPKYDFQARGLNPELKELDSGWLIHWTHSTPGRWPDEEPWRFYHDMLARPQNYVRDARSTLKRIVEQGILRGSAWKMPHSRKAVSLTALSPAASVPLMRWRKRYLRYSLEPFGLAFRCETTKSLGARPVRYFDPECRPRDQSERLFYQSAGRIGDWTLEKEWRFPGDLRLEHFSGDDLVLIAADPAQTAGLRRELNPRFRIMPLFAENVS